MQALLLLAAILSSATEPPHANSISVSRIEVTNDLIRHEFEFQTLSILEVLPELDANSDGLLNDAELESGRTQIRSYLDQFYRFSLEGGEPLAATSRLTETRESAPADRNTLFDLQRISVVRELSLESLPTGLDLEVEVFVATSPDHRDYCTLYFEDQLEEEWLFTPERSSWEYRPDPALARRIVRTFAFSGLQRGTHFELLAMLALFLLACPNSRSARSVLSIYLGVSLLVCLAGLLIDLSAATRIFELTLLLAIPYSGAENVLRGKPRIPRMEAGLFGMVAGLYLSNQLALDLVQLPKASVAASSHLAAAYLSLIFLAGLLLFVFAKLRGARPECGSVAPNWIRQKFSLLLAIIGLGLFVHHAWFSGGASLH